jgi:predicted metal-dependent enzyme (double-stranded beta helix superfamily)
MSANCYHLPQLIADLRQICVAHDDEREIMSKARPLARLAALSKRLWLEDRFLIVDPEQGFSAYPLHAERDYGLNISAVSWLPGRGAPPHDHGTWAVIAGVEGPEKNEFIERMDDGSRAGYAEVRKIGEKLLDVGEVLAMPADAIHSVQNDTDAIMLSVHIYGRDLNSTGRSQFDVEKRTASAFLVRVESECR